MIPFHIHTNYSFLQSTLTVESLTGFAGSRKIQWLAISDTDSMHGCIQFIRHAKENQITPVPGVQLLLSSDIRDYVLLYALDLKGYGYLCKTLTQKKLSESFRIDDFPPTCGAGVVFITPSIEYHRILKGRSEANVFLEVVPKSPDRIHELEGISSLTVQEMNPLLSIPVFHAEKDDYFLLKIINAIRLRTTLSNFDESTLHPPEFSLVNAVESVGTHPVYQNSYNKLAGLFQNSTLDLQLGQYKFPEFPLPPGTTASTLLWKLCFEGLRKRYRKITDAVKQRLSYELEIIAKLNFEDYFLVVWDIVHEAKRRGMMLIGRGSAANSLVSFCLGFTDVDPMTNGFYFERFLNEFRTSPPDVDLDFSWQERDEMIKYVFIRYGYDRVAMICTTVTFRARSAFREVAKVFGFSNSEISKYSKFIPWSSAANLANLTKLYPESKNLPFEEEPWKTIVHYASRLAGFPRHVGIHPGGILIAPGKITDYVALEYARNKGVGLIVTQLDMYSIEELGLVKIDLLSQRSLGVLRKTLSQLQD